MRVLTLHQPYATLIALGVKTIETRPSKTNVRGRIAIHAAARKPHSEGVGDWKAFQSSYNDGWFVQHFGAGMGFALPGNDGDAPLPLGAIVATANLIDCIPMVDGFGTLDDPLPKLCIHDDEHGLRILRPMTWPSAAVTDQLPYGDFRPGRWAWMLEDVEPLSEPIPFKGGQGWSKSWEAS